MVGPYLVQKTKDEDDIWVTHLPTTNKDKKKKNKNNKERNTASVGADSEIEKSNINENTS